MVKSVDHALKMKSPHTSFAVDLAEMLSAEMEQEGLCGRTLTLKLKTASFEVFSVFQSIELVLLLSIGLTIYWKREQMGPYNARILRSPNFFVFRWSYQW